MSWANAVPEDVVELIRTRVCAEFATVSAAGVPIDTPTYCFPAGDMQTVGVATGVAYPAKAERARRNPKVGLLFEGGADDLVVSVAGYAAVQDADLQANLNRYLAETIFTPVVNPELVSWDVVRSMAWYLARVFVSVTPSHIRWWRNRDAMDELPGEWQAAPGSHYPQSDPAPTAKPSAVPSWGQRTWQELAETALSQGLPAHLTLLDTAGHPLPIRVREYRGHPDGFSLVVPKGAPWSEGKATLSFVGKEIFVGDARRDGEATILKVERALPILPMMENPANPGEEAIATLNRRLQEEADRRGQPVPVVPEHPPEPTEAARIRAGETKALDLEVAGGGLHRD